MKPATREPTPAELTMCLLARRGLLDTELPDMLDVWPQVTARKPHGGPGVPKPATVHRHPGERLCDRCNHWAAASTYPRDGSICRVCVMRTVTICTWCGHAPHAGACPREITTSPKTRGACPCARRST